MHTCVHACMHKCIYAHMHMHAYMQMHALMRICICMRACIYPPLATTRVTAAPAEICRGADGLEPREPTRAPDMHIRARAPMGWHSAKEVMHMYAHACMYACMHVDVCMYMYACMHMHACMHILCTLGRPICLQNYLLIINFQLM